MNLSKYLHHQQKDKKLEVQKHLVDRQYTEGITGPSTDPFGTPHQIFKSSDMWPLTDTYCFLAER